jgi:hypothetical protein
MPDFSSTHAQHHRGLGRVVVEPDDIDDLVHELRIGGQLEEVLHVRLELEAPPNPPDRRLAQPGAGCHRGPGPARGVRRGLLQRGDHNVLDLVEQDRGRTAGAGLIDQSLEPVGDEPAPPAVTVPGVTRNRAATSALDRPSAQASTIFDRSANAWAVTARRDHRVSCSRSSPVTTSSAFGRPDRRPSTSPSHRDRANRFRQAPTVIVVTPNSPASCS